MAKCIYCNADEGLHQAQGLLCPSNGPLVAFEGVKGWLTTRFTTLPPLRTAYAVQAFPGLTPAGYHVGMALRDFFAAQVLRASYAGEGAIMIANRDERYDETNWAQVVAANAYEMADAMLVQRIATPAPEASLTTKEGSILNSAALPDMYDALQDALVALEWVRENKIGEDEEFTPGTFAIIKLKSAIAKALGEEAETNG